VYGYALVNSWKINSVVDINSLSMYFFRAVYRDSAIKGRTSEGSRERH